MPEIYPKRNKNETGALFVNHHANKYIFKNHYHYALKELSINS